MKQMTSYNRVAGYLNKIFDLLNEEYFEICKSSQISHIEYKPHENIFHIWTKDKFEFVFRVKKVEELEELKAKEYKKEKN